MKMNINIMHIVGNRPQFIKLSPLYCAIKDKGYGQVIIHSGQHFDKNMSDIFFEELNIPKPNANMHVSGGTHAEMTARMMIELEPLIVDYMPKIIILYGDTNTTLAAAIVTKKLGIPIVHVEAGSRTGKDHNPEEINRVIADRISDLLCAPDRAAYDNLVREGLQEKAIFSGDVMYDTFIMNKGRIDSERLLAEYALEKYNYILMTWHRQENTTNREEMIKIIDLLEHIEHKIICPLHPRTRKKLQEFGLWDRVQDIINLKIIEPVGYLQMIGLLSGCRMTLTDSGGLSKESFFAGVKSLFMVDLRVWPDLESNGWIHHMSQDISMNLSFIENIFVDKKRNDKQALFYGDGSAALKIVSEIEKRFIGNQE